MGILSEFFSMFESFFWKLVSVEVYAEVHFSFLICCIVVLWEFVGFANFFDNTDDHHDISNGKAYTPARSQS